MKSVLILLLLTSCAGVDHYYKVTKYTYCPEGYAYISVDNKCHALVKATKASSLPKSKPKRLKSPVMSSKQCLSKCGVYDQ